MYAYDGDGGSIYNFWFRFVWLYVIDGRREEVPRGWCISNLKRSRFGFSERGLDGAHEAEGSVECGVWCVNSAI